MAFITLKGSVVFINVLLNDSFHDGTKRNYI
jgi:hypothetical protein